MDLQRLYWTKNVKSVEPNKEWAYPNPQTPFKLEWKNCENNANKPQRNDLILLRQRGYVTP
ncbi:hypothetical protein NC981_01510 [Leptolyngbya sp. DQ-M1]|uniref:hypothetical protein n=1 Tax=Leptolyngbya sp. DQ-M1 TaxID=2933920 RepID=UPI00329A1E5E